MRRVVLCPMQSAWSCALVFVAAIGFGGCAAFQELTASAPADTPSPASPPVTPEPLMQAPPPPSISGDPQSGEPRIIRVSAPAETPESLTPEAAEILKQHGYDPGPTPQGTPQGVEVLTTQLKSGGDTTAQPADYDPFASKDEALEVEEYDPWERYNQVAFEFNYKFDKYLLKPVAKGYNYIMPDAVQLGIANFFQNLRFVPRMLNNVFQAKFKGAAIEGSRFLINTTLGIGGLFDPAKRWFNLETPVEDTGQTFGRYGAKPGPYLVIPLLGSFTIRDGLGYIADLALDPFNWFVLPIIKLNGAPKVVSHDDTITFAQLGMRSGIIVNERSLNLEKFQGVEEATLDLYTAVRNAYLQQRARLIRE